MGVGAEAEGRVGDVDPAEGLFGLGAGLGAGEGGGAAAEDVYEVGADGEDGVEGGCRVLEDHGDAVTAEAVHGAGGEGEEVRAVEAEVARRVG